MGDYIKREDAIKIINQYVGTDTIAERVEKDIPAADVEPVRHGKWVKKVGILWCSECDNTATIDSEREYVETNYCPHCGAKMDGEEQEHE